MLSERTIRPRAFIAQDTSQTARRKSLGVLEAAALLLLSARKAAGRETTAMDLLEDFARIDGRAVRLSGLYLLLDALERKGFLKRHSCTTVDARGRARNVRHYDMTELGMQAATAEYNAQSAILEHARPAFPTSRFLV